MDGRQEHRSWLFIFVEALSSNNGSDFALGITLALVEWETPCLIHAVSSFMAAMTIAGFPERVRCAFMIRRYRF